jgi:hypothetical protein
MKKLQFKLMTAIVIILSFSFIFASICGANETKTITVDKGDTIHKYIVKYFPEIKPSAKAYKALADFNGISNPNTIVAGKKFQIPAKLFATSSQKRQVEKVVTVSETVHVSRTVHVEVDNTSDNFKNNLFKVKTVNHTVKKGETISYLIKYYYSPKKATPMTCKALARFNKIKDVRKISIGKVLKIPNVLILVQEEVGRNPTIVSREKAIELAIQQTNVSAKEAGLNIRIDESKSKSIAKRIVNSKRKKVLNGKLALAATFNNHVQGWTRIIAKDELSGKFTSIRHGKYKIDITEASQCNNIYTDVRKQVAILPPFPTEEVMPTLVKLLPDGKIRKIEFDPGWSAECESCLELNVVVGAFHDVPVTGGYTDGYWSSTEFWFDCNGNWTNGIGYLTRDWSGESGDSDPYQFEGSVRMPAVMTRWTDETWQFVGRYSAGDRKDSGGFENEHVTYDMTGTSELQNIYLSGEYRDYEKKWFSKSRLALEGEKASNQTRSDVMNIKWNGATVPIDNIEPEDQDTVSAYLTTDVYSFDDRRNFLAINETGLGHQDNYDNTSFALKGGVQLFGGLKALVGYTWNSADEVANTRNIPSIELYPYGLWKGVKKHMEEINEMKVDSEEKAIQRTSDYEDDMNRLLEKQVLKR